VGVGTTFANAQSESEPQIHVLWNEVDQYEEFGNSEQHSQWVFGPQPSTHISYHENGTDISMAHYIVEVGTVLDINITIPKEFLGEGVGLEAVLFHGAVQGPRSPVFVLKYNITADFWESLSLGYIPGVEAPVIAFFLDLDEANSYYDETSDVYFVSFRVSFVQDVGPRIFLTNLFVVDTLNRPSSPSWLAALEANGFITPPIGLGTTVEKRNFGFVEYYFAEIVDPAGEALHYVGPDDEFVFHMMANEPFGEVEIPFSYFSWEEQYLRNDSFYMPDSFYNPSTTWKEVNYFPPQLIFVHNSTGLFVVAGYIDNVTWSWRTDMHMWLPEFVFDIDNSIDLSQYFVLTSASSLNGGADISWTGHYTNKADMHPDTTAVGATMKPDPFFWTVLNEDGQAMTARPEVADHNTVLLSFVDTFIFGTATKDGAVVHRAQQGDILNVTLQIHAPAGHINGTYYIPLNLEDVEINPGDFKDIHGVYVNVIRDNITVWLQSAVGGSNATHSWTQTTYMFMTVDTRTGTYWGNATVVRLVYDSVGSFVGTEVETHNEWIDVLDAELQIGASQSTAYFVIQLGMALPDLRVDSAHIASGYRVAAQVNVSNADTTPWVIYPPTVNWTTAQSEVELLDSRVLWTPRYFLVGNIDPYEAEKWVVTEDGAIDLDGNVFTTEDQYFVMRTGYWNDWGNFTVEGMAVHVVFDPSPGDNGDEFVSQSIMAVAKMVMEFSANETFYWYHASDFSKLNATELSNVKETLWSDEADGISNPGYKYVAWLSENRTLDLGPLLGLEENSWTNTWFAWGTQQTFRVSTTNTSTTWARFRAEYAGLLLFNDTLAGGADSAPDFAIVDGQLVTDEVTHVVLIDSVDEVIIRRPFNASQMVGSTTVSVGTPVDFGITIRGVDVTIYPLRIENSDGLRGVWSFRESYEGALGLNPERFDYAVSHATVDEMSFDVSFNVDMVEYDPANEECWNHAVSFKVDQKFGNWSLVEFDNSVLDGRSLAVNFFGVLGSATRTVYTAGNSVVSDPNQSSLNASYYEFAAENTPFSNITMGGLPYTWGGDGHSTTYISGSSTAPIGAFSLIYESSSGDSVTGWTVDASMLFMTAGYENWGGHDIICDPVFVSYTSAAHTPSTTSTTTTPTTPTSGTTSTTTSTGGPFTTPELATYVLVIGAVMVIVVLVVLVRRR